MILHAKPLKTFTNFMVCCRERSNWIGTREVGDWEVLVGFGPFLFLFLKLFAIPISFFVSILYFFLILLFISFSISFLMISTIMLL